MLKVLFIDDEPLIREGLTSIIEWGNYGYQVVGTAKNGKVGLEKIRTLRPDVVFVDIRMPGLSGIDMVKQAKSEGFPCKFVVLSGYSNFSYAQQSIRLGMESYLLKPIDEEELIPLIQQLKEKCISENLLHSQIHEYETMTEYEEWKGFLLGRKKSDSWLKHDQNETFHIASVTFIENPEKSWVEGKLDTDRLYKYFWMDQVMYLLFKNSDIASINRFFQSTSRLMAAKQHQFQLIEEGTTIEKLPEIVNQIKQLQDLHFSYGNTTILSNNKLIAEKSGLAQDWVKEVCRSIEFEDDNKLDSYFEEIERYYQAKQYQSPRITAELIEITKDIYTILSKANTDIHIPSNEEMASIICASQTLQELLSSLKDQLSKTASEINGFACNAENTIEKIIEFVERFYYKDLNLKVIADLFNYNRSYLGKKFKKQTDNYFHHYLDIVRMEKAKYFLVEEDLKVYEVSEKVGYSNNDYFYKKFKKYVGVSPKEFQKKHRKQHA
ncbi:two-component system, response regulator YesN [Gracilibacillus orientalis]|uniref:Two-component system, response regulator YesN n=1 Tax=Gracilibacillus orientalis TaxID=334253 RepID=A0A1I4IDG4_9BACI|nr:response regulator [Gracilibacillus orientalis]SFL52087.1 two-component system, response regulator YesN [Gracilibacillus orientalis]